MRDKFVLEVLNPRNAMKIEEPSGLAPRVTTLDGIRIAIISEKPDGSLYLVRLKELLEKRHPGTTVDILDGFIFKPEILLPLKFPQSYHLSAKKYPPLSLPLPRYTKKALSGKIKARRLLKSKVRLRLL